METGGSGDLSGRRRIDRQLAVRIDDLDVDLSVIGRAIRKKSFRRFSKRGFQSKSFE